MLIDRKTFKTQEELNYACVTSASFGNFTNVLRLLKIGAETNYLHRRDGWSSLHYAARWNDVKMMEALVYFGADVDLRTKSRESALHIAASFNRKEAAIYLLSQNANRTYKCKEEGKTAEEMAVDPELKNIIANWDEYKLNNNIKNGKRS